MPGTLDTLSAITTWGAVTLPAAMRGAWDYAINHGEGDIEAWLNRQANSAVYPPPAQTQLPAPPLPGSATQAPGATAQSVATYTPDQLDQQDRSNWAAWVQHVEQAISGQADSNVYGNHSDSFNPLKNTDLLWVAGLVVIAGGAIVWRNRR